MNELLTYLNVIRPLSPELTHRIARIFARKKKDKNTFILRAGDPTDFAIFIVRGMLRYYEIERNSEITKCFLQQNDFVLSGVGALAGSPSTGYLQALKDSTILTCRKIDLEVLYNDFPEFEHHARVLTQQSHLQLQKLLDNIRMRNSQERYEYLQREFPALMLSVPTGYLASFLGINRITLSRARNRR